MKTRGGKDDHGGGTEKHKDAANKGSVAICNGINDGEGYGDKGKTTLIFS